MSLRVFISEQQQQQQEKKKNYLRKTDLFTLLLLPSNALCARACVCERKSADVRVFFFGIFLKIFPETLNPKFLIQKVG